MAIDVGQGFDEYMNLVLDDAEEVNVKKKSRKSLGECFLSLLFFRFYLLLRVLKWFISFDQDGFFLRETT